MLQPPFSNPTRYFQWGSSSRVMAALVSSRISSETKPWWTLWYAWDHAPVGRSNDAKDSASSQRTWHFLQGFLDTWWNRPGFTLDELPAHRRTLTDGICTSGATLGFSILLKDTSTCSSVPPRGAGIRTCNLLITSPPALPTELQPPLFMILPLYFTLTHLNYLLGVIFFSITSHVWLYSYFILIWHTVLTQKT